MSTALYMKGEIPVSIEADVTFTFKNSTYLGKLFLDGMPTLASVKCDAHGLSTRGLMKGLGVEIPANDVDVDVHKAIRNIDSELSVTEPCYVMVVTGAYFENGAACANGKIITDEDPLADALDDHASSIFIGKVLCNGECCDSIYLGKLLSE
jgi:hypothetical protein